MSEPRDVKWSLTRLGWENPCCLRHPILQNNWQEKFVVFASDYDAIKAKADKLSEENERLKQGLKMAREALGRCRFEFEMTSKHGGYNHMAIPNVDQAITKLDELLNDKEEK